MTYPLTRWVVAIGVAVAWATLAVTELPAEPLPVDAMPEALPAAPQQIKEVADAVERFKAQDFDAALSKLKEAVTNNPQLPPAEIIMAQLFAQANQAAAFRHYLERAVTEHPDDPEAYTILGHIARNERRWTEADLLCTKASSLLEGMENAERKEALQWRILSGLAAVAAARLDWATAQQHLTAWLELDPKSTEAMHSLAVALFQDKKYSEARNKLKQAYEARIEELKAEGDTAPDLRHWGATMALLYEQAGDHEQAVQWMDYALKAAAKSLVTWLSAAQWSLEAQQLDQADEQAATALQLDPGSLEAQILRGVIALYKGEYGNAERYFETAHLKSPGNFAASNNLALALCEQEDEAKKRRALEYAGANARQRTDRQHDNYAEAWSTYGWVLYKNGQLKDADNVLSRLGNTGRVSLDTLYYKAQVAADSGRKDEAIQLLERAAAGQGLATKRKEIEALLQELKR